MASTIHPATVSAGKRLFANDAKQGVCRNKDAKQTGFEVPKSPAPQAPEAPAMSGSPKSIFKLILTLSASLEPPTVIHCRDRILEHVSKAKEKRGSTPLQESKVGKSENPKLHLSPWTEMKVFSLLLDRSRRAESIGVLRMSVGPTLERQISYVISGNLCQDLPVPTSTYLA